jgi:hypothetical protein
MMSHCASEDHTGHTVDLRQLFQTDMFHTTGYCFHQIDFPAVDRHECLDHMPRNSPEKKWYLIRQLAGLPILCKQPN